MSRHKPLISVVMPAYNAERFIAEAVQSILDQTFKDFEFIIINDGSTDKTEEIVRSFNDERIIIHNQSHAGIAAALNKGLSVAKADYIARFDADDFAYPNRLQVQYLAMRNDDKLIVLGSTVDYIDEGKQFVFSWQPPAFEHADILLVHKKVCPFIHSSVMFKKDVIIAAGGYNSHAHSFEDHLLWTRIIHSGKMRNLPQSLLQVRLNAQSITIDERWRPARFRSIKSQALQAGSIDSNSGKQLQEILVTQNNSRIKRGSYYALLAKKYLWNNYQPQKARENIRRAIQYNPFYTIGYGIWLASYLPQKAISMLYAKYKVGAKTGVVK